MNEVNRTLFIPLYGKSEVSKKNIILKDPTAERIWQGETFPIRGKSRSKWLCYNMAMRARVFDDRTDEMLRADRDALVLHIGCGLDSRCLRVKEPYSNWIDADFPDVLAIRKKYFEENQNYHMLAIDASCPEQLAQLPEGRSAIVIMEGISMYLTNEQVNSFFRALEERFHELHILMDVYTEFGAKVSKYKNPVNDVGVTQLYGVDDIQVLLRGTDLGFKAEHSFTPEKLVNELKPSEQAFFRVMFSEKVYSKIYRLFELESVSRLS